MRPRSVVLPIVAVALLATQLAAPAGAANDPYVAGASGVGDPYYPLYGNGGYDVKHYDLKIAYLPATDHLDGVARISARATENLYRFNLDFQGLTVRSVVVDGDRADWSRAQDHELIVTPKDKLRKGDRFDVVVRYDGVPRTQVIPGFDIEAGFIHTDDGAVVAGEPEVAANWFPVNDHPIDKASYSFAVTVPAGLEVIANGHLVGHTTSGWSTTWRWRAPEPMASYLATATIGQFQLHSYETGGLEMHDAIDPDLFKESTDPGNPSAPTFGDVADTSFSHQGKILDFLADTFGAYPFSAGGGVVDDYDGLFFALENQTRPIYSKYFFFDTVGGDFVVVHELAHQWFGDEVAVALWKHIWLNEGFATYAEWLWGEREGFGTTQETFDFFYNDIPAGDPFWQVVIGDPGVDLLFDGAVYVRGAMTLQTLRNEVGDDDFFTVLRRWVASRAGGNGSTEQFIALAERVSGKQLDTLFDTWLFTPGRPAVAGARGTHAATSDGPPSVARQLLAELRSGHRR